LLVLSNSLELGTKGMGTSVGDEDESRGSIRSDEIKRIDVGEGAFDAVKGTTLFFLPSKGRPL
jgi:hypothetical protein